MLTATCRSYTIILFIPISYGIQVWLSWFETNMNRHLILQKKIGRLTTFMDGWQDSTPPLFYQLNILTMKDLFVLQISCFISDCLIGNVPNQFTPTPNIHNYATRSCTTLDHTSVNRVIPTNSFFIPYAKSSYYGLRSFKIGGAKIWNNLPNSLCDISSSCN